MTCRRPSLTTLRSASPGLTSCTPASASSRSMSTGRMAQRRSTSRLGWVRRNSASRGEDLLALGGGAHAVDVAGHERDAELLLELGDAVAQPVDRQPELERGRAEAAVLDHLQEGVDVLPGGQPAAGAGGLIPGRITPTPSSLHV